MPKPRKVTVGHNSEQTRQAILQAAIAEFSRRGVAAARTDEIARLAGVNKAMIYYYFQGKELLYGAVLDYAFSAVYSKLAAILDSDLPNRDKILRYAGEHFDALSRNPEFCRVIHAELTREGSPHVKPLIDRYQRRLAMRLQELLRAGMAAGDFRRVDEIHFALSMVAVNVFYFLSAPFFRAMAGFEPFTPERIVQRRAAVLDLIAHALFLKEKQAKSKNRKKMP